MIRYTRLNNRGFSLVSALVAAALFGIVLLAVGSMTRSSKRSQADRARKTLAESYASELLETFRSRSGTQLLNYMRTAASSAGVSNYRLCSPINVLNRANDVRSGRFYTNRDSSVDLPPTPLNGNSLSTSANRFYTVSAVNVAVAPPQILATQCGRTALTYVPGRPNERLLVTVGVSWIPVGQTAANAQTVSLTSIIPAW